MENELTDLQKRVLELKKERNALILAHNYQTMDIQEVADFVGDSLELARKSAEVEGYDLVIFAGVKFMAEMAAVLSKDIPVYIPAPKALCPLAAFVDSEKVLEMKKQHPDTPVIVYVNTTADTKSESDMLCTSGNAPEIVESLGVDKVLFGPDSNLAEYVRRRTGIEIIDIEPRGHCYVHNQFDIAQIELLREEHPDAVVIAHPECPPEVQDAADMVGSTSMMARTVANSPKKKFIIATEMGLVHQMQKRNPEKIVIPAYEGAVCRQMKKNTLEKILYILEDLPEDHLVTVPEHMVAHVRKILEQMNKAPSTVEVLVAKTS
ncbi:MAG: quinolinate synthase NadA [Candidatus Lokiarchaeota archaeon]|nr:quinolinate synthase NadA [Candidatus Lokiarchaeota archaeon]